MILQRYATHLQFIALLCIGTGLSTSIFLMSLGGILLVLSWLLFPELQSRITGGFNNTYFLLAAAVFLLHIIGLIWSTDFAYASNDIRIKIPLLIFPLIFITSPPLPLRLYRTLLYLIVIATLLSTFISFGIYQQWIPSKKDISDIRNISPFVSHIRLSLVIVTSLIVLWWHYLKEKTLPFIPVFLISIWFLYFLYLLESATGIMIIAATLGLLGLAVFFRSPNTWIRIGIPGLLFLLLLGFGFLIRNHIHELRTPKENPDEFVLHSKGGCPYTHDRNNSMLENGYYTWSHVCLQELEETWNMRSGISFDSTDRKGQRIFGTMVRYITSKGLHKDREGVLALTKEDVTNIENGIANINYISKNGLQRRIEEIIFELDSYFSHGIYSGNSVTQRFEFWRAGLNILIQNPILGVGTGDAQIAFNEEYEKNGSPLQGEKRLRSHNQFLAMGVSFGFSGLILFLFYCIYPLVIAWKTKSYLFLLFYAGALISFLTEDTLETQAGVTYFCFFTGLFFLMRPASQSD